MRKPLSHSIAPSPVTDTRHLNFEKCALTSGLLTSQQLEEARLALRSGNGRAAAAPSDPELSEKIVELGLLNPWQAKQLLDGRTKFNLGSYRIIDSVGQGGMGHVFKAEDPILKRVVAIKVLPRDKSTPEAIANFTREIQALSSLNHAKLVRALDAGKDGNVNFLVTEYVPGSDLRKLVRRNGPLSMEAAANIISQVAEGLHHAHQQGIVHRDVKPGNVLVTPEGDAKLSDLGLAGPMYSSSANQDPRYGKIVGTADYLSPDHILAPWNPVPAWDVYSLGCTLYYAVTGKVPFPGGTTSDKARAHLGLKPLDPRRLNHQLSDAFVDVVADMMAKEPAQRVASALAVIERLAPWAREFLNQRQAAASDGPPSLPISEKPAATPATGMLPRQSLGPPQPPPAPTTSPDDFRFPVPVVAPPIISQPATGWEWDNSPGGDSPPLTAEGLLRDTLPDLPSGIEGPSDSEVSMGLVVDPPRRIPIGLLVALALAPLVLAGIGLALAWVLSP
jgi:eukaryotic-like serine/threonine-protein kinase